MLLNVAASLFSKKQGFHFGHNGCYAQGEVRSEGTGRRGKRASMRERERWSPC